MEPQRGIEPRFSLYRRVVLKPLYYKGMVISEGFEPSAYCFEGSYSGPLSYETLALLPGVEPGITD